MGVRYLTGTAAAASLLASLAACGGSDNDSPPELSPATGATLTSCADLATKISFPNTTITGAALMSPLPATWRVWVGDTEFNGRATLACEVHPPLQASALAAGRLAVVNLQNCVSLTVALVCQP